MNKPSAEQVAKNLAMKLARRGREKARSREKRVKAYESVGKTPGVRGEGTNLVGFRFMPDEVRAAATLQPYIVPAFSSEATERPVLTKKQASALFGVAPDTLGIWCRRGWFPEPVGYRMRGLTKIPAYSVDEILVFMKILETEIGPEPIAAPFNRNPHVPNMLFQASRVVGQSIVTRAPLAWKTIAD